jgi:tRNA (cytidine/uridine-2'-O-)-methyltransferase
LDRKYSNTERHVVLVEPEVHWNTGNIGRTCLGADTTLHLIKPLGFSLGSREVKRAGLDYWHKVKVHVWENFQVFLEEMKPSDSEVALFAKLGKRALWDLPKQKRLFLVFGSETKGLPENLLNKYEHSIFHIPITEDIRCLNLSTSVGIALYESLRESAPSHFWA